MGKVQAVEDVYGRTVAVRFKVDGRLGDHEFKAGDMYYPDKDQWKKLDAPMACQKPPHCQEDLDVVPEKKTVPVGRLALANNDDEPSRNNEW